MQQSMSMIQEEVETRPTEKRRIKCSMCDGGFSMFEDPCEACAGEGQTLELCYVDCGHEVESEDCKDYGCACAIEGCENRRKPGDDLCVECGSIRADARATYRQPYSRAEIEDAYSSPSERNKRDSLLAIQEDY